MLKIKVNNGEEWIYESSGEGNKGELNKLPFELNLLEVKKGTFHVIRNNHSYKVELLKTDDRKKSLLLKVNGNKYEVNIKDKYDELLSRLGMNMNAKVVKELKAPMPGMVLDVLISDGETVMKDQPLIILEAMKMENVLKAPADVVIKSVQVTKSNAVEKNQVLISFE